MDIQEFRDSLDQVEAPGNLPPPLVALWHQAKGDWDNAHKLVQDEKTRAAAWVHAFLHRVEGDDNNAAYWYGKAGRELCTDSLSSEWDDIAGQLLQTATETALEMDH